MMDRLPVATAMILEEAVALLRCRLWSPERVVEWASQTLPTSESLLPIAILSTGATGTDVEDAIREVAELHKDTPLPDAATAALVSSRMVNRAWNSGAVSSVDAAKMIVEVAEQGRLLVPRFIEFYAWLDELEEHPESRLDVEARLGEILTSLSE